MKHLLVLSILVRGCMAQIGTASLRGTVVDAKTKRPVPGAMVIAAGSGAPPLTRNTRSGADGAFQIQGLPGGDFSLCVQLAGGAYLDPCAWNAKPTAVSLLPGQNAAGISLKLTAASMLTIQVKDAQKVMSQLTKDGRRPELSIGVWGPGGLFYPARMVPGAAAAAVPGSTNSYQLPIPRDTILNLYIASHDLKLGDDQGAALPANASLQPAKRSSAHGRTLRSSHRTWTAIVSNPIPCSPSWSIAIRP